MDKARRRLADALYANSKEHDESRSDRLERFRNVEPPTAELLGVLIRATGARRILELGTSNGYSTIWLADAAKDTGGMVVSVDADAGRTDLARQNQPSNAVGEPDHARMLLVPVRVGGATVNVRLSSRFGGDLSVRERDGDAGAAEVDHRDQGVGGVESVCAV